MGGGRGEGTKAKENGILTNNVFTAGYHFPIK